MQDFMKKRAVCTVPDCTKLATYGYEGMAVQCCFTHKADDMVYNKNRARCEFYECTRQPTYGYEKQRAKFCCHHKLDGMTDVKNMRCKEPGCTHQRNYGFPGERPKYCSSHKQPEMVNVVTRRCSFEGCKKAPMARTQGNREKQRWCSLHRNCGEKMAVVLSDAKPVATSGADLPTSNPLDMGTRLKDGNSNSLLYPHAVDAGVANLLANPSAIPYALKFSLDQQPFDEDGRFVGALPRLGMDMIVDPRQMYLAQNQLNGYTMPTGLNAWTPAAPFHSGQGGRSTTNYDSMYHCVPLGTQVEHSQGFSVSNLKNGGAENSAKLSGQSLAPQQVQAAPFAGNFGFPDMSSATRISPHSTIQQQQQQQQQQQLLPSQKLHQPLQAFLAPLKPGQQQPSPEMPQSAPVS